MRCVIFNVHTMDKMHQLEPKAITRASIDIYPSLGYIEIILQRNVLRRVGLRLHRNILGLCLELCET